MIPSILHEARTSADILRFVLALLVWCVAGMSTFVFAYGRILLNIRSTRLKFSLVLGSLLFFVGVSAFVAVQTGWSRWLGVPLMVLLVAACVETHRCVLRHRCRGSAPVETWNLGRTLRRPLTTLDLAMRRYEVCDPAWRGAGLRVVHVSDLHVHAGIPMAYFRDVMDRVSDLEPDLLFITGDFLTQRKSLPLLARALQGATARHGVFGVLGNHDYWEGGDAVADVIRQSSIRLLGNDAVTLADRDDVLVVGCEDPWGPNAWKPPAEAEGRAALVLTHTADNIYRLAEAGPLAVFAGHYHGGQAVVPGWGPVIVPSRMGRRFTHGHFVVDRTHLFVTTGIGAAFPPVRLYCQPEILVVDFAGA